MMDLIALKLGLVLVWSFGIACLAALPAKTERLTAPGGVAWTIGAGGMIGLFLATLWLRALSLAGIHFGVAAIALPLLVATLALGGWAARPVAHRGMPAVRAALDDAVGAIWGRSLDRAMRMLWRFLLAWLALRFAMLFVEVATRPLFPWDAWTQWATKARVWYELGRIAPFERADLWFAAGGSAYFDAGPHYPGTVALMQVLAATFLGRWDDTLMNLPFWMLAVAFAFAVFGALRAMDFSPLSALAGTWLIASMPLANTHVALAGYADLPLAMYFCAGILACLRWHRTREPADAALALLLLAACPLLKIPGRIWVLFAVPALIVAFLPQRGPRIVGIGYVAVVGGLLLLAQTSPVIMGYHLHLDFSADWEALANSYFLYDNWHLLWYGAFAVALLGRRQLLAPQVAPLTAVVAGGSDLPCVCAAVHQRPRMAVRPEHRQSRDAASGTLGRHLDAGGVPGVGADRARYIVCAAIRFGRDHRDCERSRRAATERGATGAAADARHALMLQLPGVTLVCIDTANHALALRALGRSCAGTTFARVLLLTDAVPSGLAVPNGVTVATIDPITSRDAYSRFVLKDLLPFVHTGHVLLAQWDGYVVNPDAWDAAFLECDYLGAKWFWHGDGMRVGNGGFSLRSRRLLQALQDPRIALVEAEDTTIGRTFRPLLEREHAIRFGSESLADRFSFEAAYPIGKPFGFHGLFNFWQVMPPNELAALAPDFSDSIARSPQLGALLNNCMTAGQWAPAIAIARRIVAAEPAHDNARALLAQAEANAARGLGVGRNEPCPCGSGKRYKHCHGASAPTAGSIAPAEVPAPDVLAASGTRAHQRGDLVTAERDYRAALAVAPDHPSALHFLGVIHYQRNRIADALPLLERAVALVPDEPEFHNNLGLALVAADRTAEGVARYRQALALKPDLATAWNNLGLAQQSANALPEAVAAFREAVRLVPNFAQAHWNLALALLLTGQFEEGWREYEWRHREATFGASSASPAPRWQGEDLAGRTLLLTTEQGLGDALQFARVAAPLAARGARVIVQAPDALADILASVPGVAAVVRVTDDIPHDFSLPLISAAGALHVDERSLPGPVPYLFASQASVDELASAVAAAPEPFRIGLSWAGNPQHVNDRRRSCPLAAFASLFELPDFAWFSLQKDDGETQIAHVPAAGRMRLLAARNNFAQKAALIANLDLVISVDTSNAHLAGALGRPVWILLPFAPDWRWGLGHAYSAWYPTARLFRQPRVGDWASVIEEVRCELRALANPARATG